MSKAKAKVIKDVVEPKEQIATREDIDGLRDAIQELTQIIGDLVKENVKWYRAGKM